MPTTSPFPTAPELPPPTERSTSGGAPYFDEVCNAELRRRMQSTSGSSANTEPTTTTTTTKPTTTEGKDKEEETTSKTANSGSESSKKSNEESGDALFECNICLDTAKDAVVSMCGHLFCWPCLHQWLETRPNRTLCPVCKAAISKEKVIPLYGRNSTKQDDPRNKVPPRPAGQRTEPDPAGGVSFGLNFREGFQLSFGIGAFPFGFLASGIHIGEARPAPAMPGTNTFVYQQQLSKLFLYLAFFCLLSLMFA